MRLPVSPLGARSRLPQYRFAFASCAGVLGPRAIALVGASRRSLRPSPRGTGWHIRRDARLNVASAAFVNLRQAIAAPTIMLCADLPTCAGPGDRRCNRRFLRIFASSQDAEDAADADS